MKAFNIVKISVLLFLLLSSSGLYATTSVKMKRIESSLPYSQAKKLGFNAEITNTAVRADLLEYRIAVPESVEGHKIESIIAEVLNDKQSVALLHMNTYLLEKKSFLTSITDSEPEYQKYFYMNINPKIISKTILSVSCEGGYVYVIEISASNL